MIAKREGCNICLGKDGCIHQLLLTVRVGGYLPTPGPQLYRLLKCIIKSHGLYSCPVHVLKFSSSVLSRPLTYIMNNSVLTGQYPSKLKHAKVVPIFKGGNETDPSNNRPISLLSLFNWLFEKVMYNRLKFYVELYNGQYGFREDMSTQHAILDIVNSIQSNMDVWAFAFVFKGLTSLTSKTISQGSRGSKYMFPNLAGLTETIVQLSTLLICL